MLCPVWQSLSLSPGSGADTPASSRVESPSQLLAWLQHARPQSRPAAVLALVLATASHWRNTAGVLRGAVGEANNLFSRIVSCFLFFFLFTYKTFSSKLLRGPVSLRHPPFLFLSALRVCACAASLSFSSLEHIACSVRSLVQDTRSLF